METPPADILSVWEAAGAAGGHDRALALLDPMVPADAADLPLGWRDASLLRLYRQLHGAHVEAAATCPGCATTLEIRLPIAALVHSYHGEPTISAVHDVDLGGVCVRARCPTTADLVAIGAEPTDAAARAALVGRCVQSVRWDDGGGPSLDDETTDRLAHHLERLDPLADVRIDICCADCGHGWSALLDVPSLVWAHVHAAARRLLREVDALAQRYGWSEAEILSMSQRRRSTYLDLT